MFADSDTENDPLVNIPPDQFPALMPGMTISFWIKETMPNRINQLEFVFRDDNKLPRGQYVQIQTYGTAIWGGSVFLKDDGTWGGSSSMIKYYCSVRVEIRMCGWRLCSFLA